MIIFLALNVLTNSRNIQLSTTINESNSNTASEIIFSAATDRNEYEYGDTIKLIYSLENPFDTTVTILFNTSCQFDYYMDNYHFLDSIICMPVGTGISVPPETTRVFYLVHRNNSYIPGVGNHQFTGILVDIDTAATTYFTIREPNSVKLSNSTLDFELTQNYPNPFNPSTKIKYQIPELSFVTIKVYDVLGKEVTTLINEEKPAGSYEVEFDASRLPSGVYFYRLQAGSFIETKKMILLR